MKITAEPRSDQWNADDLVGSPRTFTIANVIPGKAEQKYDIELVEGEGRAWRPPLTMLRLLIAAWGNDAAAWKGRRVTLYRDDTVKFGNDSVGGIRVSHMSDLPDDKPFEVRLTSSRGKRAPVRVQPLAHALPAKPASNLTGLKAALENIGVTSKADMLAFAVKSVGREIGSATELTTDETAKVIADAEDIAAPPAEKERA